MRITSCLAVTALLAASGPAAAATLLVTTLGDAAGSCPSATNCTLRAAIASAAPGDRIEFDPAFGYPATVTLANSELTITRNLTIAGPGADRLTVQAAPSRRLLLVQGGEVIIEGLALSGGQLLGQNGLSATAGTGASGQSGAAVEGGCIRTQAGTRLLLERVALRNCLARGGSAGHGGSGSNGGSTANDRAGGNGGTGGTARGGAIAAFGELTLLQSSISNATAQGGAGGNGGRGGSPSFGSGGPGGDGGNAGAARGGAIFVGSGGALWLRNSSIAGSSLSTADGGDGGNGGGAGAGGSTGGGGDGGDAGPLQGGDLYLDAALTLADIEFSTMAPALLSAGSSGMPGTGGGGAAGFPALRQGEIVFAASAARVRSSALMGTSADLDCQGALNASGSNLASDGSCSGFTLQATFAASFLPTTIEQGGRVAWQPAPGSPVIDAAGTCNDLTGTAVAADQSGRARPRDGDGNGSAACDLGAIEASPTIFLHGFEG